MLQTLLVVVVVSIAVAYTLRRAWKAVRKARQPAGCGDCGCGSH